MDPIEALSNARAALADIRHAQDHGDGEEFNFADGAEKLADAFEALDNWMSSGGFSPWSRS